MTQKEFRDFKESLKVVFAGYKRINSKMEQHLRLLGFFMIRQKKHYIFVYNLGEKRLQFEVDKTPGDRRSGIKTACDIARIIQKELVS